MRDATTRSKASLNFGLRGEGRRRDAVKLRDASVGARAMQRTNQHGNYRLIGPFPPMKSKKIVVK
jgi:hypothetical protein